MATRPHFYSSADGLRLHVQDYRPDDDGGRTPVVCLTGLTRPALDFDRLATHLSEASATPRRVLAFDYRGRGLSEHDPDWRRYTLDVERVDYLAFLESEGIEAAHFVGTSRGGLHVMALAADNRAMIRGVVLNDIGPILEPEGLARIISYVGKVPPPTSIDDAIAILKRGAGAHFDGLTRDDWVFFATSTFGDDPDHLHLISDPNLSHILDGVDLTKPLPDNWQQFDCLRGAPLLTIRGEHSDLLSADTQEAMTARWPGCEALLVEGQGHAPLMRDGPTVARIDAFLAAADR